MGSGASRLLTACSCSRPAPAPADDGPCLDDALGHSFCYAANSAAAAGHSSSFRHAISGAALSANSSVPVPIYHSSSAAAGVPPQYSSAFHTSSSFSSAKLQLSNLSSGPLFLSGPIDRGAQLSGPLDQAKDARRRMGGADGGAVGRWEGARRRVGRVGERNCGWVGPTAGMGGRVRSGPVRKKVTFFLTGNAL